MRVFLSSTFVDMQEERDYLVKKIFPSIKAECRRRGVDFVALDLRWGINEETARSGKVVEICMDEIVRSRPFFIGLVGGRYGWIPQEKDEAITEKLLIKYPWIQDCVRERLSITEMEMQFGVLSNPDPVNAYFFLKDDVAVARKFREKRGSVESEKLDRLKSVIEDAADQGRCSMMHYSSMKSLGRQVHDALMAKIDELYPVEQNSRFAIYSRNQHEFLERLKDVYVRYDEVPELEGKVLVVGEGGIGKSAFVANHAADGLKDGSYLVYTVINNDVNTAEMCRRMLLYELSRQISGIDASVLEQPMDQSVDLAKILNDAGFKGNVRWVLDGIDKISISHEKSAVWLSSLPSQISEIVLTTSDADEVSSVVLKGYARVEISPLKPGEILEITKKYLKGFAKALSSVQEAHISNSPLLKNPETLRVFLEELLQFGVHEKLGGFVEGYLSAKTTEDLYMKVLDRLDGDFGFRKMRDVFSWIIMCENGVPEEALIKHLRVNNIEWVAIYATVLPFLSVSVGYLAMDDVNMAAAAEKHYGISSLRQDGSFAKRLVNVLMKENRKLVRAADDRMYEEEGLFEYFIMKLMASLSSFAGGSYWSLDDIDNERVSKNQVSVLVLYANAGKMKAGMKVLKIGGWYAAINIGAPKALFVLLNDRRNSLSELVTLRMALLSHMDIGIRFLPVFWGMLNFIEDPVRREEEKNKFVKKVERLPFADAEVKAFKAIVDVSGGGTDLEDLLDAEDLDSVMAPITNNLLSLFNVVSESRLKKIADKAAAALERLPEDDSMRNVCCLIAGICRMRLGEEGSDSFIVESFGDVLNMKSAGVIYDTYDLFKAVKNNDDEALARIYEKAVSYKGSGAFGLESFWYNVRFVQCAASADSDTVFEQVTEDFAELSARYNYSNLADSFYNIGITLYNMGVYRISLLLFERSAREYGDSDYGNYIGALKYAAYSAKKMRSYARASEILLKAVDIKEKHPDEVGYSLWDLYDDVETVFRESGKSAEALDWSGKIVNLLKKDGNVGKLVGAYNVHGINANSMMRKDDISQEEKEKYFIEAYNAFKEAEKWNDDGESRVLIANRASLVFEAVGIVGDVARKYVDEHIEILEKLLLQPDDKGHRFEHIRRTLADGYLLRKDWVGLKRLRDEFGLRNAVTVANEYKILYHCAEDKAKALETLAESLTYEIHMRPAPDRCEEVIEVGIVEPLVQEMLARASSGRHDAVLYAAAVKVLGDETGDDVKVQQGYDHMCRILMAESDSFRYFDRLPGRDRLIDMFFERGWTQDDLNDRIARESVRKVCQGGDLSDVPVAISDIFRASDVVGLLTELITGVLTKEHSGVSWSCLYNLRKNIDKLTECISTCEGSVADRLKHLIDELAQFCRGTMTEIDEYQIETLSEIRERLLLGCDPLLVWMQMLERINENDEPAVIDLWESSPDCHGNIWCQSLYVRALRLLNRYEEAEQEAGHFIAEAETEEDSLPLVEEMIFILRNTGRYGEAYNMVERYGSISSDWDFNWLKEILSAYTGKPAEALLLCEKRWDGTDACIYAKALYLLKMGLYNDAMAVARDGSTEDDSEDVHWLYVLYLIELARYWKNAGDVPKAKETLDRARRHMAKVHMGMCEYEAALLGLD